MRPTCYRCTTPLRLRSMGRGDFHPIERKKWPRESNPRCAFKKAHTSTTANGAPTSPADSRLSVADPTYFAQTERTQAAQPLQR